MAGGRSKTRRVLVGVLLFAVFAGSLWFAVISDNGFPGAETTTARAVFTDVGSLRPGDEVRIANVRVGQVSDVRLVNDKPTVTMQLQGRRTVYRDATAEIGARSGLGQKFVELRPGTPHAGELPASSMISTGTRDRAQDITDLLAVLDQPTREALGSSVREVGGGVLGHAGDLQDAGRKLPAILPDLGTVARALSANSGADFSRLLRSANSLSKSFAGRQQHLGELADNLGHTLRAINVDGGARLSQSVREAPNTLTHLRGTLGTLRPALADTQSAMTGLRPGAAALGAATPDVRGVLRESLPPLNKVPGVARRAQPAVDSLTGTLRDARPLAPQLTDAVTSARRPLAEIAPYAQEAALFFTNFADALKYGDSAGHYLRIYPPVGPESATSLLGLNDPTASRDVYTEPGEAANQREKSPLLGEHDGGPR